MIVLEYLLYGVSVCIGCIAFKIAWSFFPNIVSRRDKYHKSNWDLLNDRFVYSMSRAIISGGLVALCTFYFYNPDIIKKNRASKNTTVVVTKEKASNEQEPVASNKKKTVQKKIVSEKQSDETSSSDAYKKTIRQWDVAHNEKQSDLLKQLYTDYIILNGKEMSNEQCIAMKEILFTDNPAYEQQSTLSDFKVIENDYVKCFLTQHIKSSNHEKQNHISLFLKRTEKGIWQIEIEQNNN